MILSTHIVEDVEELCQRVAIIGEGQILLEAEPLQAIDELRGRIWRRTVGRDELPAWRWSGGVFRDGALRLLDPPVPRTIAVRAENGSIRHARHGHGRAVRAGVYLVHLSQMLRS